MQEISDEQWRMLEPLIYKNGGKESSKGGRPRADDRKILAGILWVMMAGEQWARLPKKYGAYVTVWRRYREWEENGVWEKIWRKLLTTMSKREELEWTMAFLEGKIVPGRK